MPIVVSYGSIRCGVGPRIRATSVIVRLAGGGRVRTMSTLAVRHIANDPAQFEVRRVDGKTGPLLSVVSPIGFPVEGRPDSDLIEELRWYRKTFPEYPFGLPIATEKKTTNLA